jgi:hypothetical protein
MNGRQMADAARQIRPGLKVLFITGYADVSAIRDGDLDPGMAVMAARVREMIAHQYHEQRRPDGATQP